MLSRTFFSQLIYTLSFTKDQKIQIAEKQNACQIKTHNTNLTCLFLQLMTANCQKITKADNMATNGVVHVIDNVLTPVGDTILNLISKNPDLSTLKTGRCFKIHIIY